MPTQSTAAILNRFDNMATLLVVLSGSDVRNPPRVAVDVGPPTQSVECGRRAVVLPVTEDQRDMITK